MSRIKVRTTRTTNASVLIAVLAAGLLPAAAFAQNALTWQQVRDRFEASNPTLRSAQINIDESRAAEVTAYLRPNPDSAFRQTVFRSTRIRLGGRSPAWWRRRASAICMNAITNAN